MVVAESAITIDAPSMPLVLRKGETTPVDQCEVYAMKWGALRVQVGFQIMHWSSQRDFEGEQEWCERFSRENNKCSKERLKDAQNDEKTNNNKALH